MPRAFGEIKLSKASTALCMAVLALERTDNMASNARWVPRSKKNSLSRKGAHITMLFARSQHQQCERVCAGDARCDGASDGDQDRTGIDVVRDRRQHSSTHPSRAEKLSIRQQAAFGAVTDVRFAHCCVLTPVTCNREKGPCRNRRRGRHGQAPFRTLL